LAWQTSVIEELRNCNQHQLKSIEFCSMGFTKNNSTTEVSSGSRKGNPNPACDEILIFTPLKKRESKSIHSAQ